MMNPYWATPSAQYQNLYGPEGHPYGMMGPWMMGGGWTGGMWIWSVLGWITWILVVVALIAFIRWMWKKGDKP